MACFKPTEIPPGGIFILASFVEADNSHRVDIVLVSCRRMEIPKWQKIATMMSSVILDRDKTVRNLPHKDVLIK